MTNILNTNYTEVWSKLYNTFDKRMQDKELEIRNTILESIMLDEEELIKQCLEQDDSTDIKYCA